MLTVNESFRYEQSNLPNGRIRLDDIRRTYSIHTDVILRSDPTLNPKTYFVAVYLKGDYEIKDGNRTNQIITGFVIHIPFPPDWGNAILVGDRAIEMNANTEFYYFKSTSRPPTDPLYRQDPTEVVKSTFATLMAAGLGVIATTSSPRTRTLPMHNTLI